MRTPSAPPRRPWRSGPVVLQEVDDLADLLLRPLEPHVAECVDCFLASRRALALDPVIAPIPPPSIFAARPPGRASMNAQEEQAAAGAGEECCPMPVRRPLASDLDVVWLSSPGVELLSWRGTGIWDLVVFAVGHLPLMAPPVGVDCGGLSPAAIDFVRKLDR